ncbi:conjugal transfer protein TrbL [Wolbachia endosymbiont of Dipetalonema caudispina]|uniref:type IV secretion system protein n=1 Tax=Wolbachia endosymbiont of Dipetalonema caudispina TaxID=1812112 RepID=UPI00158970C1|nr:type IV secretion system protein [Wolbachia endosymbiont of Dipetalonema caudispina]QKX01260.1 conjugal transfer protein TrbL [Wolbachia endosymbiont of Dipetalonema caudispina]
MNKKSLLLILHFVITACTIDCVEPGLQNRNTSINIDIPVHKDNEEIKIYWVDSGQEINQNEKIKFTLDGSINFCPLKKGKNQKKTLVPAVFCADDSIPNYSSELINNSGLNEQEICKNVGLGNNQFHSKRRYVDTKIKVNPGDKLSFSLVPREIIIDFNNPEDISFDDNCYKTREGNKKAMVQDILNGGTFFCVDNHDNRTEIKFPYLNKENFKKGTVLVGNGYTPYDNKVHFNKSYIQDENPWINGALLDLRWTKVGLDTLCNKKNCDFDKAKNHSSIKRWMDQMCTEKDCYLNKIKKYSSYNLNCYYQNICYTKEGIFNVGLYKKGHRNCVSSIRYQKYHKNNQCDIYSYLKRIEDKLKDSKNRDNLEQINIINFTLNTKNTSWAEALIAKISDTEDTNLPENKRNDMKDTAQGTQCIPERKGAKQDNICSKISDNFENFSLKLNNEYLINDNVKPGSSVMLAIADYGHYYLNRGGYYVKTTKSCEYTDGKKLYLYLGDNLPKNIPTTNNNSFKKVVELSTIENNVKYYEIDGSYLKNNKSKKIYFGIDVSNVEKNDIIDENNKYYKNNKYSITLFVTKKINDFVSLSLNKLLNFIKEEVIGNSIKNLYKGYAKGLFQGVQALLILYVIFTTIGYMLGTTQLNKFDFVIKTLKIAFITFAFSDRSWQFFGTTLSKLFIDGSTYLVDSVSGHIREGDSGRKFAFLDLTTGVLFTKETWLKFLSLILAGPFGFIAFLMILYASFIFLKCIISSIFRYIISTFLVTFLLSLTPLFIVFILFQQTKSLFENWIKTLAHVTIQPVILFSSLSILNQLLYSVLYNLTNFSACYQCLISINFLSYDLCIMKSILPLGYNPSTSVDVALNIGERSSGYFAALPIDLIQVFIYLIIASTMKVFVSTSETIVQTIFSAGWGIVGSVSTVSHSTSQSILSIVGLDDKTQNLIQEIKQKIDKNRSKIEFKSKQYRLQHTNKNK